MPCLSYKTLPDRTESLHSSSQAPRKILSPQTCSLKVFAVTRDTSQNLEKEPQQGLHSEEQGGPSQHKVLLLPLEVPVSYLQ